MMTELGYRDGADAGLPVKAFFTQRSGGVSLAPFHSLNVADHVGDAPTAVQRNRGIVSAWAGAHVAFLTAVHGIAVARVTSVDRAAEPAPADVLVTTVRGVALGAIAADCAPVLLYDGASGGVAAVHCGREGLYEGVVDAAVTALLDLRACDSSTGMMAASIGPTICGRCYEVPLALSERVATRHPLARSMTHTGTPALDLPAAIEARLRELGVGNVVSSGVCTLEDTRYFSHRRDGTTGRHAGVIVCEGVPGADRIA